MVDLLYSLKKEGAAALDVIRRMNRASLRVTPRDIAAHLFDSFWYDEENVKKVMAELFDYGLIRVLPTGIWEVDNVPAWQWTLNEHLVITNAGLSQLERYENAAQLD